MRREFAVLVEVETVESDAGGWVAGERTGVGTGVETIVTGFGVGVGVAVVNFPPLDFVGSGPNP